MNALRITGLIGITVLADQASKAAALLLLPVGESVAVLPGFFNLVPIVTAALAVLLLGESLSGWVLAGGVLAVSGVVFAEYAAKRATMASGGEAS